MSFFEVNANWLAAGAVVQVVALIVAIVLKRKGITFRPAKKQPRLAPLPRPPVRPAVDDMVEQMCIKFGRDVVREWVLACFGHTHLAREDVGARAWFLKTCRDALATGQMPGDKTFGETQADRVMIGVTMLIGDHNAWSTRDMSHDDYHAVYELVEALGRLGAMAWLGRTYGHTVLCRLTRTQVVDAMARIEEGLVSPGGLRQHLIGT